MNIAVVDDSVQVLNSIARFIKRLGHQIYSCHNGPEVIDLLNNEEIHLIISDICMPEMDGFALLEKIKKSSKFSDTVVILMTGFGDIKGAVRALKNGAYDYLIKPIDVNELKIIINRVQEYLYLKKENEELSKKFNEKVEETTKELKQEITQLQKAFAKTVGLSELGVFSETMKQVYKIAERFHQDPTIPILIEGETGTGKEMVARFIHYGYEMNPGPFVDINCASISPTLFESELFGYEAGAYTGAKSKGEKGKIELAKDGTLFLDEIGELPQDFQAKLLRVFQEREFYRVGGLKKINTNARFVGATNKDVIKEAEDGCFREDLYYRLQVGHIIIPPLRERKEEIIPLAELFLKQFQKTKKTRFQSISREAKDILRNQEWKGNVRELKNAIERIVTLFDETEITREHCQFIAKRIGATGKQNDSSNTRQEVNSDWALPEKIFPLKDHVDSIVKKALIQNDNNKSKTARYLGLTRNELYTYLNRLEA